jgi:hypothetical protein
MPGFGQCLAVLAAAGVLCAAAPAQPKATPPPEPGAAPTVSVEFAGGTVAEYVAALRKAAGPSPVNIVVSEAAAQVRLAPVSLKSASVWNAVHVIQAAAGGSALGHWQVGPAFEGAPTAESLSGTPVFAVNFYPREGPAGAGRFLEVFSIQSIIEGEGATPEVLLTAVETALKLEGDGASRAEVKFHKDSGLLLVRGTKQDVRAVEQVVERVRHDMDRRSKDSARSRQIDIQRQAEARHARIRVEMADAELKRAERDFEEARQLHQAGNLYAGEFRELESRWLRARGERDLAVVELERAEQQAKFGAPPPSPDGEQVARLREEVERLRAQVQELARQLEEARKGGGRP